MSVIIPTSGAVLEVQVLFDLSGTNPVINLTNQSTGDPLESPTPILSNLTWVLNIYSPTGTPIYTSDFDTPFKNGVWTTASITNSFPKPFGQIEWSGADYTVQFQIKDNDTGIIYNLDKAATICRPIGNTKKSTDTYGAANLQVEVLCGDAQLYIQDLTSKTYQSITGNQLSSYLVVDYPRDASGSLPTPFEITGFVNDALVPFSFNANGYKASYNTVWQYDLGDNVLLKIKYVAQVVFNVQCNIDLCPLACEIDTLIDKINTGNCADIEDAKDKLFLINAKFNLAVIAKFNPTCGLDLPTLIQEIKDIGNFSCDCTTASNGIGSSSNLISGNLFTVNNQGGDVFGSFQQTGNNVVLNLKDKTYRFVVSDDNNSNAFQFVKTDNGTTSTVTLYVKESLLAQSLLNVIKNSADLTNLFNSIFTLSSSLLISVDGKCVLSSGNLTDYQWTLISVPSSGNASVISIKNGTTNIPINFVFNSTTLSALEAKLNTLNLGTFTVTDIGSGNVTIASTNNSNTLSNLTYNTGINRVAQQSNAASSVQEYTLQDILQGIIDYLSPITEDKVLLTQDYSVPTIVVNSSGASSSTIDIVKSTDCNDDDTTTLKDLLAAYISSQNAVVAYVLSLGGGATCAAMQQLFKTNSSALDATALIYGFKNKGCAALTPTEVFQYMLSSGVQNAKTKQLFCDFVSSCGAGLSCEIIDFDLATNAHSASCSAIVGIQGSFV